MTIDQFLEKIPTLGVKWQLIQSKWTKEDQRMLRTQGACRCPVEYAAYRESNVPPLGWLNAGRSLNMSDADIQAIVFAADQHVGYDPELRRRLLEKAGIRA